MVCVSAVSLLAHSLCHSHPMTTWDSGIWGRVASFSSSAFSPWPSSLSFNLPFPVTSPSFPSTPHGPIFPPLCSDILSQLPSNLILLSFLPMFNPLPSLCCSVGRQQHDGGMEGGEDCGNYQTWNLMFRMILLIRRWFGHWIYWLPSMQANKKRLFDEPHSYQETWQ